MNKKQKKMLIRVIIAAVCLVILFFIPWGDSMMWRIVKFAVYTAVYIEIGYDILIKAGKGIIKGQVLDENFLMAIATIGAYVLAIYTGSGDYVEAIAVMLFYQTGELFQSVAVGKSRKSISDLMDIRPDTALIMVDGELTEADPDDIEIGSEIIVRAGDKIPIDGVIIEGTTTLDTAALTGESMPREASVGDSVLSGCINLTGTLTIRTTKEFGESTASKILELVENSSSNKSRSENFITRFARVYTPAVCILALILAFIPPVISGAVLHTGYSFETWIYRALTFLVISCPCALVISIPLTFFAGLGAASRSGVLVKGSNYLEALSKTGCIVMDKTGTLTVGRFKVTEVHSDRFSQDEILMYAAAAEQASTHPIALALCNAYKEKVLSVQTPTSSAASDQITPAASDQVTPAVSNADTHASSAASDPILPPASDITEHSGKGISAVIDSHNILAGNYKLMDAQGISYISPDTTGTVVHVAVDGDYAGYIILNDVVKPTSKEAINNLTRLGVDRIVMLTGDNEKTAADIASQLGITEYKSNLLPEDKVSNVENLLKDMPAGKVLSFAGDGINDAPVLAMADVGIAMGALGSDAAIEAADVVLMDDDPASICKAIRISRRSMRIVYENIVFAIGVKLICLALGALGIANMWLAIFADVGVMVIAVLNAIRALRIVKK